MLLAILAILNYNKAKSYIIDMILQLQIIPLAVLLTIVTMFIVQDTGKAFRLFLLSSWDQKLHKGPVTAIDCNKV